MTEDLIGKSLGGYTLKKLLGHGGMAQVYQAVHSKTGEQVALKVIEPQFDPRFDYALRFERESHAIEKLKHPNVVGFRKSGKSRGVLYLVMEYIEGHDLHQVMERYRSKKALVPDQEILKILHDIGAALDYSHQQGVIHRDVKPSNIMIDRNGRAILTDFGLALLAEIGTKGEIFGTPRYISPEQAISSATVVPQSDIYALGVIAYELFTGRIPFDAENALDIAMLHMSEPPPPPRQFRPEMPAALEGVLLKVLSKEPQQRYPSGAEFVGAVEKALTAKSAKRTTTTKPVPKVPEEATFEMKPRQTRPAAVVNSPTQKGVPTAPEAAASASGGSRWKWLVLILVLIAVIVVAVVAVVVRGM